MQGVNFMRIVSSFGKRILVIVSSLLCLPTMALASASDIGSDKISTVLGGLVNLLTSTPAKVLFVLSIIGIGYGWLHLGKIPKEQAIASIIGIGIVFSAGYIAQQCGLGASL